MKKDKPAFLFIKCGMMIGGIEVYLINLIRWLRKYKYRIIFIELEGTKISEDFSQDLLDGYVEVIKTDIHNPFWKKPLDGLISNDEPVISYAFDIYQYALLDSIKKKYHLKKMNTFFWVPHFNEKHIFLELNYPQFMQKYIKKYFQKILLRMDYNRNIIYVNPSHVRAFENNYDYKSKYGNYMLIEPGRPILDDFDMEKACERSKREPFRIITIGRFVFPHKSYLLGLIDSYARLKPVYSNLELVIIGDGKDKNVVINKIESLPEEIKKSIKLEGSVYPSKLKDYLERSSINIGVAASIQDGLASGVISIPVRHYVNNCEGYGFFTDMKEWDDIVSDKPGTPIENYIKEAIELSEQEYIELSKKSYECLKDSDGCKNFGIREMSQRNVDCCKTVPGFFIRFVQVRYFIAGIIHKITGK